jgi:proteasome alpha subunit
MSLEDAATLAIAAINLKAEKKEGLGHIKMAKVTTDSKIFEKISESDLEIYAQNTSKFSTT